MWMRLRSTNGVSCRLGLGGRSVRRLHSVIASRVLVSALQHILPSSSGCKSPYSINLRNRPLMNPLSRTLKGFEAVTQSFVRSVMAPNTQTYGALLIGGLVAMFLSGIVSTQVFLYFRNYPGDRLRNRTMVSTVWILDLLHAGFVCASVWRYLIHGFQDDTYILSIAWTVSVTVSITGFLTFLVHCFFTHRVWTLSRHSKWMTFTIMILAFLRMISAFGTVIQMHRFRTWHAFHEGAAWSFTTGLAISAVVDFLIAFSLCWFLRKSRTGFSSMDQIIDSIMVYTIENGFLTSIVAVASLICWLTMPGNFIFLALHFAITKLYANSLLATLNARTHLKEPSHSSAEHYNSYRLPTLFSSRSIRKDTSQGDPQANNTTNTLQINVEKSVHYVTDIGSADLDSVEPAYLPRRASSSTDSPFTDLATPYKS